MRANTWFAAFTVDFIPFWVQLHWGW